MTAPDPDEVLTAHQAAQLLGVHYKTVLRFIDAGDLHAVKRRGRIYIRRRWVDDFLTADHAESA